MHSIIEQVARKNGVDPEAVLLEMELAIDAAMDRTKREPAVAAYWNARFPGGKRPSVEQFIKGLARDLTADGHR